MVGVVLLYDFAVERDLRTINPALGVDRPKVPPGDPSSTARLSEEVVTNCRTMAAAIDPRLEALVSLLVLDGLKVAEALALDVDDIAGRPLATTIVVRRRHDSKRIVLHPDSARCVRQCTGRRRSGPVFLSEQSSRSDTPTRLTRFGADHLIRQLRNGSTTEQVTANALRRFHINARQARGNGLEEIRDGVGLADVRGVQRYVGPATENER